MEGDASFIYSVGYSSDAPYVVKTAEDGSTVWQRALDVNILKLTNVQFFEIIQVPAKSGYSYVISGYNGTILLLVMIDEKGSLLWLRQWTPKDTNIVGFLEPVPATPAFYFIYSDKNGRDSTKSPFVLKFDYTGTITAQKVLTTSAKNTGFIVHATSSHSKGLGLAGRVTISAAVTTFLIELDSDLKVAVKKNIREPLLTVHDIFANGSGDYVVSAYSDPDAAVMVSHVTTTLTSVDYYTFPGTSKQRSALTPSASTKTTCYLSVYDPAEGGKVHSLDNSLNVLWTKQLVHGTAVLGVKQLDYNVNTGHVVGVTVPESLLVHAETDLTTCITQSLDKASTTKRSMPLATLDVTTAEITLTPDKPTSVLNDSRSTVVAVCDEDKDCVKDKVLCALYDQVNASFINCFGTGFDPEKPEPTRDCAYEIQTLILNFDKANPSYHLVTNLSSQLEILATFIDNPSEDLYLSAYEALVEILTYLYTNGDCNCNPPEPFSWSEDMVVQSTHLYLQAAGSKGNDSPEGIQLRWLLKGGLSKHLPKANYATTTSNFNKPDDYVRIYRTPYKPQLVGLDLSLSPDLVNDTDHYWVYNVNPNVFYVRFINTAQYDSVRASIDPSAHPLDFFTAYGAEVIEVEDPTKLFFAVTSAFINTNSSDIVKLELLSVEDNQVTAPKRATLRQTYLVNDIDGTKVFSENIRSIRFSVAGSGIISVIDFEFYTDVIAYAAKRGDWQYGGKYALTKDTPLAYSMLEPTPGTVHGKWLRYNDQAFVNVNNYQAKWNSPTLDPENRILNTVDQFITLSDDPANPEGTELIYYNDPSATPIPGYEPDPDFDPSDNQFELSNLYVLQLASMDYHVARMLGLGVLDLTTAVHTGSFVYMAEYFSSGDLGDGLGKRDVTHLYCSLPTATGDFRLPLPVDLKDPIPGVFQGLGTEAPTLMTDADGYSPDGKTRYLSLFNEALPEEDQNRDFFYSTYEFISANSTIPVYAGIEYRASGNSDWVKPELPFDPDYFNVDSTVPPEQTNETRSVVLPEAGYPLFIHREKSTGWHDYSSYGINWFSRATSSDVVKTIETTITPTNTLQPPTNINTVLIRQESPLFLTTAAEQTAFAAITTPDKTFIRLTFDYNHGQELIDYHKEINGQLINGYAELPDAEELFAEDIEVFFRNEIPNSVSGQIVSLADDPSNPILAVITTGQYTLYSVGDVITPSIPSGLESHFIGSALSVDGVTYIIHQVNNSGTYPVFTVFKNDANGFPVALTTTVAPGDLTSPPSGGLFIVVENMLSTGSWPTPSPLSFTVDIDLTTIYQETVTVHIPDGSNETHVQKFRGVYDTAFIEKVLEDDDDDASTPMVHLGLYKMTFTGLSLPEHPQASGPGHRVERYKGVVRVHTNNSPNGPRKALQVITTENIGTSSDLVVYAVDPTFDASNPSYDEVGIGNQLVNYYPGYRVYFYQDVTYGLTETAILPGPTEEVRYSIFGLRSHDSDLSFVSPISQPVLMYAQKIELPLQPRKPQGGLYATRPDFFGKASYTFTTQFEHKPYSVQFGRASDIQILSALWRSDIPVDPNTWTVKRINEELFGNGDADWYAERWQNLLGFDYHYPTDPGNDGLFELLPNNDPAGIQLPLPNNSNFIDAINAFISAHNGEFGTSITPIVTITSLYETVIPAGPQNAELQVIDFMRDVIYNCFVPLTEIPVIYQYIKGLSYSPVPKKQVTRDERGELLSPTDPDFDMAPMMKIIGPNPAALPPKTDDETQFTDFGIDGASNAKYFYISREFNLQMKTGPYSAILGPINLVNTAPPKAPEVIKIVPILENRNFNVDPAIELRINSYVTNQHIHKVNIYRARSLQDALSIRTMDLVKVVDVFADGLDGNTVWAVQDDFSDLGYVPYGDPLFYVLTVSRLVKYNDRDGNPVTEFQPSAASKLTATNIVENYNPEAPALSYTSLPENPAHELESVHLLWNKTVYNGKYHVYKMNEKGTWIKIADVQTNDPAISLSLADTDLGTDTLALRDADGNRVYHQFKVVSENFAGMLSTEEKLLSI